MALPPQVYGCGDNRPHGVGTYGLYGTETEEREGNGQELRHFHYTTIGHTDHTTHHAG